MVDVAGHSLTEHERDRLRHPSVGGVILFARNFTDRDALTALWLVLTWPLQPVGRNAAE